MSREDVKEIAELDKKCFALPWSEKSFYDETENPLAYYFKASEDGRPIGYAGFWSISGEGGITNIAVLPDYRRRGVGSALMETLIKRASQLKLTLLTLEVRKSNLAAQGLYKKYGFAVLGERKRYYSDNGEDALIMTKELEKI